MERIKAPRRAKLFKTALESTPVGRTIQCTGLDDDLLCSNLKARDSSADCLGCGAIDLVTVSENVANMGNGILKKIGTQEELS